MKTTLLLLGVIAGFTAAVRAEAPKLEVHEWGTFTVVSGSNGEPLSWYQPGADLDQLPVFVNSGLFRSKASFARSVMRMETPVIYFYPESEMKVKVGAKLEQGRITEWFPSPHMSPDPEVVWEGSLHRPNDKETLARVPEVVPGKGDHYQQARNVPDAWLFRNRITYPLGTPVFLPNHDAEKFIFYRGVGDAAPPYRVAHSSDGKVILRHFGFGEAITHAFALQVENGKARWARLPRLDASTPEDYASMSAYVSTKFDAAPVPVEKAEADLTAVMENALTSSGLSTAEARAMIATWHGHWFRESGTRVLAIMPRPYVDAVLPLTITPKPTRLERVFVTRFEVFTPDRELALLDLLDQQSSMKPDASKAQAFSKLELGRFGWGALLRAQDLQDRRMEVRFSALLEAAKPTQPPATAAR